MLRVAERPQVQPAKAGASARLALIEPLLRSLDVEQSAQLALEWLATRVGIENTAVVVADATDRLLIGVAGQGSAAASAWRLSIEMEADDSPLLSAYRARTAIVLPPGCLPQVVPGSNAPILAIPLRGTQHPEITDGVLLVESPGPRPPADLLWVGDVLGEQISRLRSRDTLADSRFGRERMLLYSIINAVADPILLTDNEGRLIVANSRAERLLAAPEESSEGWRRAVGLNNMLFSAALSTSTLETDEPSRREVLLVDPIEGTDLLFELICTPVKDAREGTFVVSILRNVTDLERAAEEIEESRSQLRIAQTEVREERHRLELIIDSVADPIVVTDAFGDIALMNAPADKLFQTAGDRDESIERRVHANFVRFTSFVSNVLFGGEALRHRGEIALVDPPTGAPMPVEAIAGKVVSGSGELTWVVTILHDRTEAEERARLYEQLERGTAELEAKVRAATAELAEQNEVLRRQAIELEHASALKSQFLANMSHEFRTPLNAILGYTHMLLKGLSGELLHEQRTSLERVDANSRHLLSLINDILDITRIEAGKMPLHFTAFALPELVREVTAELEPLIARTRLPVKVHIAPRFPRLRSDRQKVKQILSNLLSNALKFTREGSVTIRASQNPKAKTLTVSVTDTGIGIAEEDLNKVFEDFRQLDPSTTRAAGGTGLGLAVCRRLATMLEGSITVESALDVGSTFTLHLPVRAREP
jgi:signal transduction histidine kinase